MSPETEGKPGLPASLCFAVQAQRRFPSAGRCAGLSAACENAFVHVLAAAGPVIWTARYHGVYKRVLAHPVFTGRAAVGAVRCAASLAVALGFIGRDA